MSKYKAKKARSDGIWFDSIREMRRYEQLKVLQRAGRISHLELQPAFVIVVNGEPVRSWTGCERRGRKLKAVMDFAYFENGRCVVEDAKGVDNPLSRFKRALVEHIYKVEIRLV